MAAAQCTIYSLSSSKDGRVRYIGQTTCSVAKRLIQHLAEAKRSDFRVSRWIRKVISEGHRVEINTLEQNALLNDAEVEWIAFYRMFNRDLTNTHIGGTSGNFGRTLSEETRKRMSKPKSMETRARMSKPRSDATKVKMSLAQMGNKKGIGEKNGNAKMTAIKVLGVRSLLEQKVSLSKIAAVHGVTKATIWKIKTGQSWTSV